MLKKLLFIVLALTFPIALHAKPEGSSSTGKIDINVSVAESVDDDVEPLDKVKPSAKSNKNDNEQGEDENGDEQEFDSVFVDNN